MLSSQGGFPSEARLYECVFSAIGSLALVIARGSVTVFSRGLSSRIFPTRIAGFVRVFSYGVGGALGSQLPSVSGTTTTSVFTGGRARI